MNSLTAEFVITRFADANNEHDKAISQVPFALLQKGPGSIRKNNNAANSIAYVMSNGGDLDLLINKTS
jgi:hypothetical protein|tara:strand:+ start:262 stop:465 length:204 start_codon:yes stop_codon:yes gene_type:complete